MSWANYFKLGLLGYEIDIPVQVTDISVEEGNIQLEERNLSGGLMRSYIRQNVPMVTLSLGMITDSLMSVLRGLQASLAPLNFIFNSSLVLKYLPATSASTTSIVIPPTSATGVVITGVFLQTDYLQTGTNYYSGGSTYDSTTGTITLASTLPGANTDVFVNYSFTGISAWAKVSVKPHRGVSSNYWQGTLTLTGA